MARMNMRAGAGGFGPLTLVSIFVVISDMGAWLCVLGAASAIQHKANTIAPLLNANSATLTYMDLPPQTEPRKLISYEWFKAVLQILTLIFCLIVLVMGQTRRFRVAMVGLLAVLAMLWIQTSQTYYYIRTQVDANEDVTGKYIARSIRAWFAGAMMSAGFNLALIILLGIATDTEVAEAAPAATYTGTKGAATPATANENYTNGNAATV